MFLSSIDIQPNRWFDHSVFDTFVQLTEGHSAWNQPKQVPVRSSFFGSLLDSPFAISDSPLLGSVPSRCSCFTLLCAPLRGFVILRCLLRYWLDFYLNWQLMTTVSPLYSYTELRLVYNIICSKPIFTKSNRQSILVANGQLFYSFKNFSIFQPMEQALPSPSDGWHACSRRCQLALDLTVRGTGYTHPPLHSPGDCNVVGVV